MFYGSYFFLLKAYLVVVGETDVILKLSSSFCLIYLLFYGSILEKIKNEFQIK